MKKSSWFLNYDCTVDSQNDVSLSDDEKKPYKKKKKMPGLEGNIL